MNLVKILFQRLTHGVFREPQQTKNKLKKSLSKSHTTTWTDSVGINPKLAIESYVLISCNWNTF